MNEHSLSTYEPGHGIFIYTTLPVQHMHIHPSQLNDTNSTKQLLLTEKLCVNTHHIRRGVRKGGSTMGLAPFSAHKKEKRKIHAPQAPQAPQVVFRPSESPQGLGEASLLHKANHPTHDIGD
jgi:hypothetical protein